jgi:hypothetical protein
MRLKLALACFNRRHDACGTFARRVSAGDGVSSFLSAVFDKTPLTALALKQGGYDWGPLAYAVGFGGSMIWFGSSAGVAILSFFSGGKIGHRTGKSRVVCDYRLPCRVRYNVNGDRWHPEPKERPKHG